MISSSAGNRPLARSFIPGTSTCNCAADSAGSKASMNGWPAAAWQTPGRPDPTKSSTTSGRTTVSLSGCNEWLARCGLENPGQAGPDEIVNNVGAKTVVDLTLHGKIANIPASEVEVLVQKNAPYRDRKSTR